jgi:hypothetical protein
MTIRQGNMFDFSSGVPDVLLFTANSTVTRDGRLVMGRGTALQVRDRYPGIDKAFGTLITGLCHPSRPIYNLLVVPNPEPPRIIGAFQVKYHYSEPAVPDLIRASVADLTRKAATVWFSRQIWLPFPGIGAGRLPREVVYPLIKDLPDNITIWEKP